MLFKKGVVTLDCYTKRKDVYEYSRIKRGINSYPDWWKNLPKSGYADVNGAPNIDPDLTMRSCAGFIDLFKNSWSMPLWCDFRIVDAGINAEHTQVVYADRISEADFHGHYQYGDLCDPAKYQHIKILSPWLMFCNSDVDWAWMPPVWHTIEYDQLNFLPAVANFRANHISHINFFLRRMDEPSSLTIPFGTPIQHFVPLTERRVEVKCHLVDEAEYKKLEDVSCHRFKFLNDYSLRKRLKK